MFPGLPRFELFTAWQREAPDDSGFRGKPRDRHPEPLQVAVDRVVAVDHRMFALRTREGSRGATPNCRLEALLIVDHEV